MEYNLKERNHQSKKYKELVLSSDHIYQEKPLEDRDLSFSQEIKEMKSTLKILREDFEVVS